MQYYYSYLARWTLLPQNINSVDSDAKEFSISLNVLRDKASGSVVKGGVTCLRCLVLVCGSEHWEENPVPSQTGDSKVDPRTE